MVLHPEIEIEFVTPAAVSRVRSGPTPGHAIITAAVSQRLRDAGHDASFQAFSDAIIAATSDAEALQIAQEYVTVTIVQAPADGNGGGSGGNGDDDDDDDDDDD